MNSTCWTLDYPLGKLRLPDFCTQLDLEHPDKGFYDLRWHNSTIDSSSLLRLYLSSLVAQTSETLRREDSSHYVRGTDLVATYGGTGDEPVKWTVYWRVDRHIPSFVVAAVTLIVSVETALLDSQPMIEISTSIPTENILLVSGNQTASSPTRRQRVENSMLIHDAPHCLLFRLPGSDLSYAEMAHPSDFQSLTTQIGGISRWQLFGQFLEKGVIRRARMQGVFLPRKNDSELAARCYREFCASKAPLTT